MGLNIGTAELDNLMLGNQEVDKIMLGTTEVWSNNKWATQVFYSDESKIISLDQDTMAIIKQAANNVMTPAPYSVKCYDISGSYKKLILGRWNGTSSYGNYELNPDTLSVSSGIIQMEASVIASMRSSRGNFGGTLNYFWFIATDRARDEVAHVFDSQTYSHVVSTSSNTRYFRGEPDGFLNNGYTIAELEDNDGASYHRIYKHEISASGVTFLVSVDDARQSSSTGGMFGTSKKLFSGIDDAYVEHDPQSMTIIKMGTFPNGIDISRLNKAGITGMK